MSWRDWKIIGRRAAIAGLLVVAAANLYRPDDMSTSYAASVALILAALLLSWAV